ncbi:MAG: TetR/AcrR family transcriptional regulator C-terminal domain-containing protein [Myxococcota bacterium]
MLASLVVPDDDDWQAGLREISSTLRRHFEASTGMALEAIKSDQWPEWLVELHELGCARMVELGVPADAAWLAIRTVAEFVEGFVARQDVRRTSGTPLQQASLHRYPTLKRVSATLGEDEMEATFQFGLDAILAGLGALYPTR